MWENLGHSEEGAETIQNDIILKAKSILELIDALKKMYEKRKNKSGKKSGTVYKYKYKPVWKSRTKLRSNHQLKYRKKTLLLMISEC